MSERDETFPPQTTTPVATGPLIFVLCLALFLGGLWLMAVSFDHESGLLFGLGILSSSLAFLVPMQLLRD